MQQKLTKFLIEDGFKVNPYDWCEANKMVDRKQLTIVWHVDDLKYHTAILELSTSCWIMITLE
jgi:hypothetical protein